MTMQSKEDEIYNLVKEYTEISVALQYNELSEWNVEHAFKRCDEIHTELWEIVGSHMPRNFYAVAEEKIPKECHWKERLDYGDDVKGVVIIDYAYMLTKQLMRWVE